MIIARHSVFLERLRLATTRTTIISEAFGTYILLQHTTLVFPGSPSTPLPMIPCRLDRFVSTEQPVAHSIRLTHHRATFSTSTISALTVKGGHDSDMQTAVSRLLVTLGP